MDFAMVVLLVVVVYAAVASSVALGTIPQNTMPNSKNLNVDSITTQFLTVTNATDFAQNNFVVSNGLGQPNDVLTTDGNGTTSWVPLPTQQTVFPDNTFVIEDNTDTTKTLTFDVQGATATTTNIITNPSVSRTLTTPDIDGTFVVAQTGTNEVFIGSTGALHGSNSGIQYSTTFLNRAQIRENQYGNNAGIPGISTFKSRATTIGSLAPVIPGDVIYRATAVGVTDNLSIPLSGLISILVPPNGVPAGQGWIATDYEIQLVPLAGPANGRRQIFRITSEGVFHVCERVNSMAGVAVTSGTGSIVVANSQITATSRITLTIQSTGSVPTGFVYVSAMVPATSFTITSSTADVGVAVYYQIWEPTV